MDGMAARRGVARASPAACFGGVVVCGSMGPGCEHVWCGVRWHGWLQTARLRRLRTDEEIARTGGGAAVTGLGFGVGGRGVRTSKQTQESQSIDFDRSNPDAMLCCCFFDSF